MSRSRREFGEASNAASPVDLKETVTVRYRPPSVGRTPSGMSSKGSSKLETMTIPEAPFRPKLRNRSLHHPARRAVFWFMTHSGEEDQSTTFGLVVNTVQINTDGYLKSDDTRNAVARGHCLGLKLWWIFFYSSELIWRPMEAINGAENKSPRIGVEREIASCFKRNRQQNVANFLAGSQPGANPSIVSASRTVMTPTSSPLRQSRFP